MFLVKREESRGFDVFFGCFVCVFGIWNREKCVEKPEKEQKIRKMSSSPGLKGAWAIYSPDAFFEAAALQRLPASKGL